MFLMDFVIQFSGATTRATSGPKSRFTMLIFVNNYQVDTMKKKFGKLARAVIYCDH